MGTVLLYSALQHYFITVFMGYRICWTNNDRRWLTPERAPRAIREVGSWVKPSAASR
jgi:hypothetical protein